MARPPNKRDSHRLASDSLSLSLSMPGVSAMSDSEKRDKHGDAGPSSVSCTVCLDPVLVHAHDRGVTTLACGHRFHLGHCFFHLLILLELLALFFIFSLFSFGSNMHFMFFRLHWLRLQCERADGMPQLPWSRAWSMAIWERF